MAGPVIPTVRQLDRPEPLQDVLAKDRPEDCLPCRVMGASAFIALGGYTYFSGHAQLKAQQAKILASKSMFGIKSRQAGITSIALTLAGMGFWRMVN
ncbi:hypothetical protein LARI1_G008244 [Lachnellula arida]|uniref:Distal membrane-arm assembly complex protein 1-like domain-containing protein n=2 Tax=Lachnellula TaxID=47830 RepID=A0A8T9B328_9HELO|nr:hypothetical protein LARI1_G008244 [Lachnellula arida]TVY87606.1 hypothetical protein LAWI1_G006366 [Lachnellula willkommii]